MAKIKNKWTEKDIRDLFNRLDKQLGVDSSDVPINVNNRLKSTIARYRYYGNRRPYDFEFGRYIMNVEDKKALDDVAIHEYAHWYQASVLKSDSGHNPEFRQIVKSLGSDNYHATCTKFVGDEYRKAMKRIDGNKNIIGGNTPKHDDELSVLMRKYSKILRDEKNYSKKDGLMYVIVKGKGDNIEISGYYKTFKKANEFAVFVHRVLGIEDARILTLSK
jgi:predicted SprT family Zn-dependent metalloprotease